MSSDIGELINQMNPKRAPTEMDTSKKELEPNKKTSSEEKTKSSEKFKSNVKETVFDYYKIIGVEPTASALEIKRAYQAKLKKLNPIKVEQTKENKLKYKLLREAGDLLSNPHERKAYDMQRKAD